MLFLEILRFILYSSIIVIVSKFMLVPVLRKLAEGLNLKAKTVGNISGIATSMPELLSVCFASATGLISTSIVNILSSNIINFLQYTLSVVLNKNWEILRNRALTIDLIMVIVTIIIPIILLIKQIEVTLNIIPIFILLFILFYFINNNTHNLYLSKSTKKEETIIKEESRFIKGNRKLIIKNTIYLIVIGIILFVIGSLLSNSLEELCRTFNISEFVVGISLGFITSIPELITFFESQKHYKKSEARLGVVEATNNLLTSNILNLFIIQTIGIVIYKLLE